MPTKQSNQALYYAHSGKREDLSDGQTLLSHLSKVSEIAEQNAQWFGAQQLAKYTGLLHDLGKYCPEFLKRLKGGKVRVDHATAGARIAVERWQLMGKLIAYCIAGHHAGLANGIDKGQQRSTLDDRLKLKPGIDIPHLDPLWQQEIMLPTHLKLPAIKPHKIWPGFQLAFFTRMIFSCLIDADRKDTNNYYRRLEEKENAESIYPPLPALRERFNAKLAEIQQKLATQPPKSINQLRQRILNHSRKQAELPPGLFSLTVPTGGGKTYTSMAFALDHAITHQLRRIIYVIPFTSIIEQNANVFREAFGDLAEAVIEHHSAFDDTKLPNNDARDTLKRAMESWDAPVIVTTAVQFFESLFADRPSQCRKLHNIAGSVIILDEAQTLPLKLLRPIMAAIDELALNYRCSIVLCTATQPALKKAEGFINGFENVREISPDPLALFTELERVTVKNIGEQTDEQLLRHLQEKEQVLIIVNNRRHARSLYDSMKKLKLEGATHLTTLMCAKHRSQILEKVREDLLQGKLCRLVSTSLIEAGVDVDFPCVLRAEAGLDSIAQAAGRCNREGKSEPKDSEVLIFQSPDWRAPPELEQLAGNMREVMRNHSGNFLSPGALTSYFNAVYWSKGEELDKKKILETHNNHCRQLSFPFQNIARDFRMIETMLKPVIIEFDDKAERLLQDLEFAENESGIARQLQVYLVQMPEHAFKELLQVGAIKPIKPEKFGDQFWRLTDPDLYDGGAGLSWDNPVFIEAEKTII
ncbi:CRISPR-associated helicase Cas3' [Methylicorpusculum sp.]|uniref:CRISPR-associated helicase Cas3' n=1 Tax=Methylicorpusculum sp. TaxID=2713644 RepID=UPI002AB9C46C|nr:CRISPR-associated helicase Cas3' [Methylicorpusculum sp.]MDZ4151720.1 CRISPR-associated helicase Cas3' [Methylicorpusculum sp.]